MSEVMDVSVDSGEATQTVDQSIGQPDIQPSGNGFFDNLSEETRSNPSMLKFKGKNVEDVAKSYINLQTKINSKGVIVPQPGAPEEEIRSFYTSLGCPEKPDDYQITLSKDLHKSIQSTPETMKMYKDMAHKFGLNSQQAQGIHEWYMEQASNVLSQQEEADQDSYNSAMTNLRSRWGATFDQRVSLANTVLNKFAGNNAQKLIDSGFGNNPIVIEMLSEIGSKISEDTLGPGGKGVMGLDPAAAKAEITEINNNPKHPYWNGNDPMHKEAVERMTALMAAMR